LDAPLDVIVVRKVGAPGHQELAMGAVASGGILVRNEQVISGMGIDEATFTLAVEQERREVHDRDVLFRGEREPLGLRGKIVIVVDDGIATGSTMSAALRALRQLGPSQLVAAVPVAPPDTVAALVDLADDIIALHTPTPFVAVGAWYQDFRQVPDKEVRRLLDRTAPDTLDA
jgi:putative phosphoribosyl transferase